MQITIKYNNNGGDSSFNLSDTEILSSCELTLTGDLFFNKEIKIDRACIKNNGVQKNRNKKSCEIKFGLILNGSDNHKSNTINYENSEEKSNTNHKNSIKNGNIKNAKLSSIKTKQKKKIQTLSSFSSVGNNIFANKNLIDIVLNLPYNKIQKKISDVKLPPSGIQIRPKNAFSVKMEIFLDIVGKYMIDINLRVRSSAYNTLYNTLKLKGKVRDSPKEFRIVDGNVESLNNKKLTFDVNYPFKIKEAFHNKQLNECFIGIKIKNNTIYPITICDLFLSPKLKKAQSSKLSDILSMDKNNNQENMFMLYNNNFKDLLIKILLKR